MKRVLLLLFLLTAPLSAQGWRTTLTGAANAALWIDCMQTVYGVRHGIPTTRTLLGQPFTYNRAWEEGNPLLGHHPAPLRVVAYNIALIGVNTFAPKKIRPWVNAATLLVEVFVIRRNAQDVGMRFTP